MRQPDSLNDFLENRFSTEIAERIRRDLTEKGYSDTEFKMPLEELVDIEGNLLLHRLLLAVREEEYKNTIKAEIGSLVTKHRPHPLAHFIWAGPPRNDGSDTLGLLSLQAKMPLQKVNFWVLEEHVQTYKDRLKGMQNIHVIPIENYAKKCDVIFLDGVTTLLQAIEEHKANANEPNCYNKAREFVTIVDYVKNLAQLLEGGFILDANVLIHSPGDEYLTPPPKDEFSCAYLTDHNQCDIWFIYSPPQDCTNIGKVWLNGGISYVLNWYHQHAVKAPDYARNEADKLYGQRYRNLENDFNRQFHELGGKLADGNLSREQYDRELNDLKEEKKNKEEEMEGLKEKYYAERLDYWLGIAATTCLGNRESSLKYETGHRTGYAGNYFHVMTRKGVPRQLCQDTNMQRMRLRNSFALTDAVAQHPSFEVAKFYSNSHAGDGNVLRDLYDMGWLQRCLLTSVPTWVLCDHLEFSWLCLDEKFRYKTKLPLVALERTGSVILGDKLPIEKLCEIDNVRAVNVDGMYVDSIEISNCTVLHEAILWGDTETVDAILTVLSEHKPEILQLMLTTKMTILMAEEESFTPLELAQKYERRSCEEVIEQNVRRRELAHAVPTTETMQQRFMPGESGKTPTGKSQHPKSDNESPKPK